jgi:hypothetical protein
MLHPLPEDLADTLEEFACAMYGKSKLQDINDARYAIFSKLYAPRDINNPLQTIKSSDPSCVPPCKAVLRQKIERVNYIAMLWRNAIVATPIDLEPENHG